MTETSEQVETSEAEIAVHWREEEFIYPSPRFIAQANTADPSILERFSEKNFRNAFANMLICLPGTGTGIRPSIRLTRHSGTGSLADS